MAKWVAFLYPCIVFSVVHKDMAHAFVCNGPSDPDIISRVLLKVYNGSSSDYTYTQSTVTNSEILRSLIFPERDTVVYIHGYLENAEEENVQIIIRAYLARENLNFILAEYGKELIFTDYYRACLNVPELGKAYAKALNKLASVINPSTFHIIGHSLGAQIGAHIARFLHTPLHKLTGLDPAFPLFYPSTCHIASGDAETVVIIHTNAGVLGTPLNSGTIDFWANNGINPQPGCTFTSAIQAAVTNFLQDYADMINPQKGKIDEHKVSCIEPFCYQMRCSHQMAVKYFAESVTHPKAFPAMACTNNVIKANADVIYFGDSTPKDARGQYCFTTNPKPPYGKPLVNFPVLVHQE